MKNSLAVCIGFIAFCCLLTSCITRDLPDSAESSGSKFTDCDMAVRYPSVEEFLDGIQKGSYWVDGCPDEIKDMVVFEPADGYVIHEIVTFDTDTYQYWLHPVDTCNGSYPDCNCKTRIFVQVSYVPRTWDEGLESLKAYYYSDEEMPQNTKSYTYTKYHAAGRDVLLESAVHSKSYSVLLFYEGHDITVSYDVASGVEAPDLTQEGELEKLVGAIAACRLIPMEDIRAHGRHAAAE